MLHALIPSLPCSLGTDTWCQLGQGDASTWDHGSGTSDATGQWRILLVALPGAAMTAVPGMASTTRGSNRGNSCSVVTAAFSPNFFFDMSLWFWPMSLLSWILLLSQWFYEWLSTALFLLKLARSGFYRVPISILTDCTLHWLSAANPSGKQKPQPLPQTSSFLLRENDLGSNLQLTEQWNST